jgi:alkanesulfonate monooxygenase SsuD/methylene tetrahydromethanopterin reductase-like flavin-dependent oxidoreductase (luciferase family)
MNIKKEREAFEAFYKSEILTSDHEIEMLEQLTEFHLETGLYEYARMQTAWESWQASALRAKNLEGCVVVPKDQVEVWWQDAEEPENFATTIESIPALGENLGDKEIMEIDEHHTIHLPSKRVYGTWVEKDGERSFVTGSLEECRAMLEAARGGNE